MRDRRRFRPLLSPQPFGDSVDSLLEKTTMTKTPKVVLIQKPPHLVLQVFEVREVADADVVVHLIRLLIQGQLSCCEVVIVHSVTIQIRVSQPGQPVKVVGTGKKVERRRDWIQAAKHVDGDVRISFI